MRIARTLPHIYQLLFGILVFVIPSNLFLKFFESSAYVNGLLSDYLLPKFYISDIVIGALIGVWLWEKRTHLIPWSKNIFHSIKKNKLLTLLVVAGILRQVNTVYPFASLWYGVRLIEFFLLGVVFVQTKKYLTKNLLLTVLTTTVFFQSSVALYQFFMQKSVFGYLFFGEGNLSKQINLAKQTFGGVERILPYGTTAHPNILGAFLAIALLCILVLIFKTPNTAKNYTQPIIIIPCLLGIVSLGLTFSLSAWLIFVIGCSVLYLHTTRHSLRLFFDKKLIYGVTLILLVVPILFAIGQQFTQNTSITRRAYLNETSLAMVREYPFWGVGLNNFTAQVEAFSPTREVVRFVQPSHHSMLLLLSEIGFLGVLIIILLVRMYREKINKNIYWLSVCFLIISPALMLDHYLVTSQTGILSLLLLLGVFRNFVSQPQK